MRQSAGDIVKRVEVDVITVEWFRNRVSDRFDTMRNRNGHLKREPEGRTAPTSLREREASDCALICFSKEEVWEKEEVEVVRLSS